METSGVMRRAFSAEGHDVISCDLLPAQDDVSAGRHIVGEVMAVIQSFRLGNWWPDLAIMHPTCTVHTVSAAWAFNDPDFERYPGVGYHQKIKPGTLTGAARRAQRDVETQFVKDIWALDIEKMAIENPVGTLSTMWMKPTQVIQPNWFGDDASKATCLWLRNLPKLRPTGQISGRFVDDGRPQLGLFGTGAERWSNQTDAGQNRLTQSDDRWQKRSDTFPGIARACAEQWR